MDQETNTPAEGAVVEEAATPTEETTEEATEATEAAE